MLTDRDHNYESRYVKLSLISSEKRHRGSVEVKLHENLTSAFFDVGE
jgi:hypothetical protein